MLQSLERGHVVDDIVAGYGHLVLDECHHLSAVSFEAGRAPILLTERKEHERYFPERLGSFARNVLVLQGGMGARQRRDVMQRLEQVPDREERVLVATGRYVGEGFDDARLDTLFLTMPIPWQVTLAQYVGRLRRRHPEKREVAVYNYLDGEVAALRCMAGKRIKGYETLGYTVDQPDCWAM